MNKHKTIEKNCKNCQKVFQARVNDLKRGFGLSCSRSCGRSKRKRKLRSHPLKSLSHPNTESQATPLMPYYEESSTGITLYHGDCQEVLEKIKETKVSAVITDPPFSTTNLSWDKEFDLTNWWKKIKSISTESSVQVVFACQPFTTKMINSNPKGFRYELIWEKTIPVGFLDAKVRPLRSHENILIFSDQLKKSTYNPQMVKGKLHKRGWSGGKMDHYGVSRVEGIITDEYYPRSVLKFKKDSNKLHKTQKPLRLMEWLVSTFTNPGDTVLEPFSGSGSTAVACRNLGRKCIAIEKDPEFCEITVKRLSQEVLPLAM